MEVNVENILKCIGTKKPIGLNRLSLIRYTLHCCTNGLAMTGSRDNKQLRLPGDTTKCNSAKTNMYG